MADEHSGSLRLVGLPSFGGLAYVNSMPPKICAEARRALIMLSEGPEGCTEAMMLVHGFNSALIAVLVGTGLAIANAECMPQPGESGEVMLIKITDAGRVTLEQV